jgi:hypothetical protein
MKLNYEEYSIPQNSGNERPDSTRFGNGDWLELHKSTLPYNDPAEPRVDVRPLSNPETEQLTPHGVVKIYGLYTLNLRRNKEIEPSEG